MSVSSRWAGCCACSSAGRWGSAGIVALALLDLAIPIWAERSGRPTPWHPEHIAERYGLFTIIVLGECVLASSSAVQLAMAAGEVSVSLLAVALGGLLLVFALWWSYFKHPAEIDRSLSLRQAVAWGYSHYVVFAAIAALGAGLQVAIDATHEEVALSPTGVALTVAIPVIVYTVAMGLLHRLTASWRFMTPFAIVAVVVVAIAAGRGVVRDAGRHPADGARAGRLRGVDGRLDGPTGSGGGIGRRYHRGTVLVVPKRRAQVDVSSTGS